MIKCRPGVEHWHGATPETDFAYLAITMDQPTKWLERVPEKVYKNITPPAEESINNKEAVIALSGKKWKWMADKNVDSLNKLFDSNAVFVHMGGSWGKTQELNVIKNGGIWYKKADIHSISVHIVDNTAILLNDITLLAEVGGREVTHPFMVTEVYIMKENEWKLGSLSFTKLLRSGGENYEQNK